MTAILFFKIVGAFCIVFCGWSIGNQKVVHLRKKATLISDLLHLLELLCANFTYVNLALPQFFEKASETGFALLSFPSEIPDFTSWKNEFSEMPVFDSLFSPEEKSAFLDYWQALGSTGPEEELDRLAFYREKLHLSLSAAQEQSRTYGRMYRNLGASLAAIIAVLLL